MRGARRGIRDARSVATRWSLALWMAAAAAGIAACAVGPSFKRPAPPADSGYGAAPSSGATAGGGRARRRRAAFRRRRGCAERLVDAVQVAQARSSGRAGAQGQSQRRGGAGGAQAGPRAVPGTENQFLSQCAGKLRRRPLRVSDEYADRTYECLELHLQSLHRAVDPDLHARRVRRHPPGGGDGQGRGTESRDFSWKPPI